MYLHLELKQVPHDRLIEAIERLSRLHALMAQNEGFVEAQTYRYLGSPGQYLVVRTWQDAEAHKAYRASPEAVAFGVGRSAVMPYKNLVVQHWDELARTAGDGVGDFLVRTLHKVGAGSDDAYLDSRRRRDSLDVKAGGVVDVRTYRPLSGVDDEAGAMVLERRHDRAGYDTYLESPASTDYEASVSPGLYTTELVECYEVVQETRQG